MKRNVQNKLLILQLLTEIDFVGITRLQKIIFRIQEKGRNNKIPTFNYEFINWNYGYDSSEINKDINFMKGKKLIELKTRCVEITENGRKLLRSKEAKDFFSEYPQLTSLIIETANEMSELSYSRLIKENLSTNGDKGTVVLPIIEEEQQVDI